MPIANSFPIGDANRADSGPLDRPYARCLVFPWFMFIRLMANLLEIDRSVTAITLPGFGPAL